MDISKLQFRDKNPRLIKAENLEKLKKSIQDDPEFLAKRKILVNDTKDGKIVYAGNQRLRSLLALGYTEVPDEWIDIEKNIPLKLMEKRAFKDNVEYGEYDHDKLKDFDLEFLKELDLPEWELDLSELNDIELDEDKEDSIPEPAKVAKLIEIGDIIQLWPHRIMCGDSLNVNTVETLLDWKKINMVFTDPPYGMNLNTDYSWMPWTSSKYKKVEWDDKMFDASCIMLLQADIYYIRWADYFPETIHNYHEWNFIVWSKRMTEAETTVLWSDYEICWTYPKQKKAIWFVRWINQSSERLWEHPTQKPTELWVKAIDKSSKAWDIVGDLFLGSWSTLIACEKTNRVCYGMELDPVYIEVIIKRYHDYTKWARDIKILNRDIDLSPILKDEK